MAGASHKRKSQADGDMATKVRKLTSEPPRCPERARYHHCLKLLQRSRPCPRVRPLPVNANNTCNNLRFGALDMFPRTTDVDLRGRCDISIFDKRQTRRIKSRMTHLEWCRVCLDKNNSVVYINFPCGHMANCKHCNPVMHKCACCGKDIDHTVYCPVSDYDGCFPFMEWFADSRDH